MRRLLVALAAISLLFLGTAAPAQSESPCHVAGAVELVAGDSDGLGGTGLLGGDDGLGGTGASGDDDGIGGTGASGDDGIGGTGIAGTGQASDEDGIGGTGIADAPQIDDDGIGGTGVYGTLTAFGSLCVNGLHIFLDAQTDFSINSQPARREEIALGQVLWVRARTNDRGLVAGNVTAYSAVVGTVTAAAPDGDRFSIGTQTVRVEPETYRVGEGNNPSRAVEVGDFVDVSGLRDAHGDVIASRIERLPERPAFFLGPELEQVVEESAPSLSFLSIEGYLDTVEGPGDVLVSGIGVEASGLSRLQSDSRVIVSGALLADGALRVDRALRFSPTDPLAPGAEDLEIQKVPVPQHQPNAPLPDAGTTRKPGAAQPDIRDDTWVEIVPLPDAELDIDALIDDQLTKELLVVPGSDSDLGKTTPVGVEPTSTGLELDAIDSSSTLANPGSRGTPLDSVPTLEPRGDLDRSRLPGR